MKKICLMILVAVCFNSCSDDPHPGMRELVLDNIRENDYILDEAFARTAEILREQGDLELLVSTTNTRDAFITKMNGLIENVVSDVIEMHAQSGTGWATSVMEWDHTASHHAAIQNNLRQLQIGIGANPASGALELYSNEIDNKLALLQGDLILLENHKTANGSVPFEIHSFSFGRESASINFTKISYTNVGYSKESIENLILTHTDPKVLDNAIEDFVAENRETEILISMLIPAVQKCRTASTGTKTSYQVFSDLVFGTQIKPDRNDFDKQVRDAAFLSAVDFVISDDFYNDNEDYASIPLQDAMHHAACVMMWGEIYDLYHK